MAEYAVALAAFTAVNLAGVVLANQATVRVARGNVSVEGSKEALVAGAAAFALSPFAGALGSYLVGRGSDHWRPKLGWATLGGYGVATLALAGGYGIATTDVNRDTARALNGALYLAVPLGSVLLQNATKSPR